MCFCSVKILSTVTLTSNLTILAKRETQNLEKVVKLLIEEGKNTNELKSMHLGFEPFPLINHWGMLDR